MGAVAAEWEKVEWLVTLAQKGDLIHYVSKDANLCRRDVVNNAELLRPLILELGTSS